MNVGNQRADVPLNSLVSVSPGVAGSLCAAVKSVNRTAALCRADADKHSGNFMEDDAECYQMTEMADREHLVLPLLSSHRDDAVGR